MMFASRGAPGFLAVLLPVLLLLLLPQLAQSQAAEQSGGLVRFDLSAETPWRLCNANRSIQLPVQLPAHVLGTLAAAGVVQDPLYRDGELTTRWVSEEHWNFTTIWAGSQHASVVARRHVLLVLKGVDTFGQVVLNGRHLAATNNAHRSWWLPLSDPARLLRDSTNLLSVLLQPAVAVALRDKATYPYDIPTMVVPGGFDVYNFARKPASDFGWDWGPAFGPAGITGSVELLGFDRATVIGALVHQQAANRSCFSLTITAHLLVPEEGDSGLLTAELPALALASSKQMTLAAGGVGGSPLQALAELQLDVPAAAVRLWQPRGLLPPSQTNLAALYDLRVSFTPSETSSSSSSSSSSGGGGGRSRGGSGSRHGDAPCRTTPCSPWAADSSSSVTRRVGFRTIELVRQPIRAAEADFNRGLTQPAEQQQQQQKQAQQAGTEEHDAGAAAAAAAAAATAAGLVPGSWADVAGFYNLVSDAAGVQQQAQVPPGFAWPDPVSSQVEAVRAAVSALCLGANVSDVADAQPPAAEAAGSGAAGEAEAAALAAAAAGTATAAAFDDEQQQQQRAAELRRRKQLQQLKRACESKAADAAAQFCAQRPHACAQQQQQSAAAELPSQPVSAKEDGESFYFRVNGVPLFAKGANLIPLHVLSTAVRPGDAVQLLRAAADANMNMVRIWGGGRYQIDALYDAADELGLLVWQEAMFACSPYPRDASLLANVESEVTQQLLRLGSHPSIAIWGGNNEVEAALDWYPATLTNPRLFAVDYNELFVEAIGSLVQRFLPGAPWVDSSPSNGYISVGAREQEQQQKPPMTAAAAAASGRAGTSVKRWGNPQNPRYGDVHFYNYRDDCQDWRTYPEARFVSEYGWQSYPSWATYSAATAPGDWQLAAPMTEFRQRHPNGTVELLAQLQRRFKLPDSWLDILQHPAARATAASTPATGPSPVGASSSGWLSTLTAAVTAAVQGLWQQRQPVLQQHIQLLSGVLSHVQQSMAKILSVARTAGREGPGPALAPAAAAAAAQPAVRQPAGASPSSSTAPASAPAAAATAAGAEMRDFIYLTQLQQLLCYETALGHWRRLRSTPGIHTMGVLYWQLNDLWAGASWSSIDYGGVWKPLHYGVARAFADLSLSVRQDLHNGTIQAYVVSDLLQPVRVRLTIRLLSLTDSPGACSSSSWKRFEEQVDLAAPAGAAVLGWAGTVAQLLAAAGNGCSRHSCYLHVSLSTAPAAGGAAQDSAHDSSSSSSSQEATVWLAPFAELQLRDPRIRVSDFRLVQDGDAAAASGGAFLSAGNRAEFTVRSDAVAAFAVWELVATGGSPAGALPGHFSDNALTLHPCEPRRVAFVPHDGGDGLSSHLQAALQQQQQQQQRRQGWDGGDDPRGDGGRLLRLLQQQLAVSSLFDHQQFAPEPSASSEGSAAGGSRSSEAGDRAGWRSQQQRQPAAAARVVEE